MRYSYGSQGTVEGWLDRSDAVPLSRAFTIFSADVRMTPSAQACAGLAGFLDEKGDYEEAIATCNEAIRLDRTCGRAYYNRGKARWQIGEYNSAYLRLSSATSGNSSQFGTGSAIGLANSRHEMRAATGMRS